MNGEQADGSRPIRTILAGTDFSEGSFASLRWAAAVAAAHSADLRVVHAVEPRVAGLDAPLPRSISAKVDEGLARCRALGAEMRITLHCEQQAGRAWKVLLEAAARRKADLVVVGTRGLGAIDRLVLGSTADRLVRTSMWPVVTVRGEAPGPVRAPSTVLVATDFSEEAARATSTAVRLLRGQKGARLHLMHCLPLPEVYVGMEAPVVVVADDREAQAAASRLLQSIAAPLGAHGISVQCTVEEGWAAAIILNHAKRVGAELIALGTHGRGGVSRALLGSVALGVVHRAECPVLTVRHPDATEPVEISEE
jgi:nucleotide-binding universal stress UspA family protein